LEKDFAQVDIIRSDPVVSYKETISEENSEPAMSKSQNKHNRLHGTSSPLDEKLVEEIENGKIGPTDDVKIRSKRLVD